MRLLIASFILGGDDFQKGLKIAVSSGWDTDCNAGNLGALNGIRLGLAGLEAGPDFRGPVADLLYVVGADGGECVSDAVIETRRVLRTAAGLSGSTYDEPASRFAFEFPGSVQGFAPCPLHRGAQAVKAIGNLNTSSANNGLELRFEALAPGVRGAVSVPTFIDPKPRGVSDTSYFEVIASPTLYATQTVRGTIRGFDDINPAVRFFIHYFDETDQLSRIDGPVDRHRPWRQCGDLQGSRHRRPADPSHRHRTQRRDAPVGHASPLSISTGTARRRISSSARRAN